MHDEAEQIELSQLELVQMERTREEWAVLSLWASRAGIEGAGLEAPTLPGVKPLLNNEANLQSSNSHFHVYAWPVKCVRYRRLGRWSVWFRNSRVVHRVSEVIRGQQIGCHLKWHEALGRFKVKSVRLRQCQWKLLSQNFQLHQMKTKIEWICEPWNIRFYSFPSSENQGFFFLTFSTCS